jgi:hypothetical protein
MFMPTFADELKGHSLAHTGLDGLGEGFLRSKAGCVMQKPRIAEVVAVGNLRRGEDLGQETFAVLFIGCLDTRNVNDVRANADDHDASPIS